MTSIAPQKAPYNQIFIFVALMCEAKPLIQLFALKKECAVHPFVVYKADKIVLTVSGVGKVAMAGAVAYSLALFDHSTYPAMLNIGIAGHKTQARGCLFRAMKVIDQDACKSFYPPMMIADGLNAAVLTTVSQPVTDYKADMLYDMEGSAFYEMAVRFSSSELVQCIKIVSDNERFSVENINKGSVYQWIDSHMEAIDSVIKDLMLLSEAYNPIEAEDYQQFIQQWHFSLSGKVRLKALLLRWKVMTNERFVINKNEIKNGKDILKSLEAELGRLEFFL